MEMKMAMKITNKDKEGDGGIKVNKKRGQRG